MAPYTDSQIRVMEFFTGCSEWATEEFKISMDDLAWSISTSRRTIIRAIEVLKRDGLLHVTPTRRRDGFKAEHVYRVNVFTHVLANDLEGYGMPPGYDTSKVIRKSMTSGRLCTAPLRRKPLPVHTPPPYGPGWEQVEIVEKYIKSRRCAYNRAKAEANVTSCGKSSTAEDVTFEAQADPWPPTAEDVTFSAGSPSAIAEDVTFSQGVVDLSTRRGAYVPASGGIGASDQDHQNVTSSAMLDLSIGKARSSTKEKPILRIAFPFHPVEGSTRWKGSVFGCAEPSDRKRSGNPRKTQMLQNRRQAQADEISGFGLLDGDQPAASKALPRNRTGNRKQRPVSGWTPNDVAAELIARFESRNPGLTGYLPLGRNGIALAATRKRLRTTPDIELALIDMFLESGDLSGIGANPASLFPRFLSTWVPNMAAARKGLGLEALHNEQPAPSVPRPFLGWGHCVGSSPTPAPEIPEGVTPDVHGRYIVADDNIFLRMYLESEEAKKA